MLYKRNWFLVPLAGMLGLIALILINAVRARADDPTPDKMLTLDLGNDGVKLDLVLITKGTFLIGTSDSEIGGIRFEYKIITRGEQLDVENEGPQHEVEFSQDFLLGKYEVTRGQFRAFVNDTGYKTDAERSRIGALGLNGTTGRVELGKDYNWRNVGYEQSDEHPVVCVSWNDAQEFCKWLSRKSGKRVCLPTEAQWEYACRAGTKTRYSSGDDPESLASKGNISDGTARKKFSNWLGILATDGYVYTAPVGSFKPNAFGLYDMHGNVWEWCQDWYEPYEKSSQRDPTGAKHGTHRVLRGGSWTSNPYICRSATRYWIPLTYRCASISPSSKHRQTRPPLPDAADPETSGDSADASLRSGGPSKCR